MEKEDILARSRRENKNRDLAEQEVQRLAAAVSGSVGALVCCLVSVAAHLILDEYLYSPWAIYFSIMGTQWVVRYVRLKRRSDLVVAILMLAASACSFISLVLRMLELAA